MPNKALQLTPSRAVPVLLPPLGFSFHTAIELVHPFGVAELGVRHMNKHQVSVAAESFAASLFAQAGYDVLVQYGANQPYYDIVAVKKSLILKVSVKGSSDGGWMLAQKQKGIPYHECIDKWHDRHGDNVVFIFIQYKLVSFGYAPRAYIATTREVASRLKAQLGGKGCMFLIEDYQRDHPKSKYTDKISSSWTVTRERIDLLAEQGAAANP